MEAKHALSAEARAGSEKAGPVVELHARRLTTDDRLLIALVQGAFKCQVRDPEDCSKVRQFSEVCSEEVGTSLFPILSASKLAFKRCLQQGSALVVGTVQGAPAAVVFNTGLKASGGEVAGTVFAVVAVAFVAPGPGEPYGAAEAFVTFRRQAELPARISSSDAVAPASFPDRTFAIFDASVPTEVPENLGWKMIMPQNPTGLGACGCEDDMVCPDGVRGMADTPNDEYWAEIVEQSPVPNEADPAGRDLEPAARAALAAAHAAAAAHPAAASRGGDDGLPGTEARSVLSPVSVLPEGLAKNSRLMRLPKGIWDGRKAHEVADTIVEQAQESFDFARRNPGVAVTMVHIGKGIPILALPFLCRLGTSRVAKMCAALLAAELPWCPGVYQALTVLPLHQVYPMARCLGHIDKPAQSWLHSSPRTPWCNAADFDGKFRDDYAPPEPRASGGEALALEGPAEPEAAGAAGSLPPRGSYKRDLTVVVARGGPLVGQDSPSAASVAATVTPTGDDCGFAATDDPTGSDSFTLPAVAGEEGAFPIGDGVVITDVIRGSAVALDPAADAALSASRDAPAVAGRSGSGTPGAGVSSEGQYSPSKWDGRVPRGLFLPFVPYPIASEAAITRVFGKWAPILSVSVWSASSGRRVNAAVRFASQKALDTADESIRAAAWEVRRQGESRFEFVDDDGSERFLWIRPLENREPRGGSTRRSAKAESRGSGPGGRHARMGQAGGRHGGRGPGRHSHAPSFADDGVGPDAPFMHPGMPHGMGWHGPAMGVPMPGPHFEPRGGHFGHGPFMAPPPQGLPHPYAQPQFMPPPGAHPYAGNAGAPVGSMSFPGPGMPPPGAVSDASMAGYGYPERGAHTGGIQPARPAHSDGGAALGYGQASGSAASGQYRDAYAPPASAHPGLHGPRAAAGLAPGSTGAAAPSPYTWQAPDAAMAALSVDAVPWETPPYYAIGDEYGRARE